MMKPEKPTKSLPSTAESFFITCLPQELCTSGNDGGEFWFSGAGKQMAKSPAPAAPQIAQVLDVLPTKGGHRLRASLIRVGRPVAFWTAANGASSRPNGTGRFFQR
ncbi:MAG: hypothetical protein R2788_08685 [Saprospiraceae bacterium]